MEEIWPHPYFDSEVDVGRVLRDTMRVCLKSTWQMVYGDHPPAWVLILDEHFLFYPRRSRVVLNGTAIIDCELLSNADVTHNALAPQDATRLRQLLRTATEDSFADANTEIIDGHPCTLTVINGLGKWMAVCEFNLAGMPDEERTLLGPSIAEVLVRYSRELAVLR